MKKVIDVRKSWIKTKIVKKYHGRVLTTGFRVAMKDYFNKRRESSYDLEVCQLRQMVMQMQKKLELLEAVLRAKGLDKVVMGSPSSASVNFSPIGSSEELVSLHVIPI
ncbi:hypothetical protein LIER_16050 [Lithospermum erythrorhizon]|uniref:Uncharacterized protein n=1 Tax=Lithospermum erythrorhizon TaxID=34254 RepID=A0AAV3Q7M1_LITER